MRIPPIMLLPLVLSLTLAACTKQDNAPGPGGVSMGEARALDEAAEMVEGQRLPPEALASPAGQAAPAAKPTASAASPAKN